MFPRILCLMMVSAIVGCGPAVPETVKIQPQVQAEAGVAEKPEQPANNDAVKEPSTPVPASSKPPVIDNQEPAPKTDPAPTGTPTDNNTPGGSFPKPTNPAPAPAPKPTTPPATTTTNTASFVSTTAGTIVKDAIYLLSGTTRVYYCRVDFTDGDKLIGMYSAQTGGCVINIGEFSTAYSYTNFKLLTVSGDPNALFTFVENTNNVIPAKAFQAGLEGTTKLYYCVAEVAAGDYRIGKTGVGLPGCVFLGIDTFVYSSTFSMLVNK